MPNFFSGSQTDPGFQNKNIWCRLTGGVCALLLKSFVMSVSARCIYRFVCTIALQTIHEIEILKLDLKPRNGQSSVNFEISFWCLQFLP